MRNTYTNEIAELHKWVENTDYQLGTVLSFLHTEVEVQVTCQRICFIANCIQEEYPFYASHLPVISQRLFSGNRLSGFTLNSAVFGELYIITQQLFPNQLISNAGQIFTQGLFKNQKMYFVMDTLIPPQKKP
jgi:hypothetical protein